MDASDAAEYVQELAGDDANIIFGAKFDESVPDSATITVIATGLSDTAAKTTPFGTRSNTTPFGVRKPAAATSARLPVQCPCQASACRL